MLALILAAAIDLSAARTAVEDLDALCRADAGKLWNVSLCGPIVLVDPQTRDAVTWAGGELKATKVPAAIAIANTRVDWDGRRWTMVMWPLPEDTFTRRALLGHESWHRVQDGLGFKQTAPDNAHLDDADGRTWLRLEWRALARALEMGSKRAVEDALLFRAKRRALIAGAAEQERLLEIHEGLAEYTGTALAEPRVRQRAPEVVKILTRGDRGQNFIRSFAYVSGPAWGAVIDLRTPRWTRALKATDDLGVIAQRAWKVKPSGDAEARAAAYGGTELHAEEKERAERKRVERLALRATFIDGPTLTVPIMSGNVTFDPNGLQPLEGQGTVYRTITLTEGWGKLEVTSGGALVSSDWKRLVVPAGGAGYTLTLNDGWAKVPAARAGDFTIGRK